MNFLKKVSLSLFLCASGLYASPFAYVCSTDSMYVYVIDRAIETVTDKISLSAQPVKVVVSADGNLIFVADTAGNLNVASSLSHEVIFTLSLENGGIPCDLVLSPDGKYLHVLTRDGTLTIFDMATYKLIQVIPSLGRDSQIALSPDGESLYISTKALDTIDVYDRNSLTSQFTCMKTIERGELHFPSGIVVHPNGSVFYVINEGNNSISVIDSKSFDLLNNIYLSDTPLAIAITPDGSSLYVSASSRNSCSCSSSNGNVFVINTVNFSTAAPIKVGPLPHGLAITADGNFAYVTDLAESYVRIISTATLQVLTTVNLYHGSDAIYLYR